MRTPLQEGNNRGNTNPPPRGAKPEAPPPQRKHVIPDSIPREHEKEKIKRQLYNLIDRVDKL